MTNIDCPAKDKWAEIERLVASIRIKLDAIDQQMKEKDDSKNKN
jgi:hypothetical protein